MRNDFAWVGPGDDPAVLHDAVEHYRGEDLLTYGYQARNGWWWRWDGPDAIWRMLPGAPDVPVYRLYDKERHDVLSAQTRDLERRRGVRD